MNIADNFRNVHNVSFIQSPEWKTYTGQGTIWKLRGSPFYQSGGFDFFVWSRETLVMSQAFLMPYMYGRPYSDESLVATCRREGLIATTLPDLWTYHIPHLD
jgi:hypothetical protein